LDACSPAREAGAGTLRHPGTFSPAEDGAASVLAWVVVCGWDGLVENALPATLLLLELEEPHAASVSAAPATAMAHAALVGGLAADT
jgi:hypothetical protein